MAAEPTRRPLGSQRTSRDSLVPKTQNHLDKARAGSTAGMELLRSGGAQDAPAADQRQRCFSPT